jgi:hypothetical protein
MLIKFGKNHFVKMKKRGLIALLFTLIFSHISAVESLDYLVFTFERIQQTSIHRLKTQKVTEYYYWITPMPVFRGLRPTMNSTEQPNVKL